MKEIELLKIIFKDSPDILNPLNEIDKEIERLNKENEELKHKLKLINSYVYGCDIDSLGSDKE